MNDTLQEKINNIIKDEVDKIRDLRSAFKSCLEKTMEFATDAHKGVHDHDKSVSLQLKMAQGFLNNAQYYNQEIEKAYERMENRISIERSRS